MKWNECSKQEQWVLEQLEQGEWANLRERSGEAEDNRRLSAKFIEALLTDDIAIDDEKKFRPHRKGIRIAEAVIAEAVDLEQAEVNHIVDLDTYVFKERVSFRDAHFKRHLVLSDSHFLKALDGQRLRVENFFCRGTSFRGPVDFAGADIGGQFNADGAQFGEQDKEHEAIFNSMKVGQAACFDNAVFRGPVDFITADIGGQFNAVGAKFLNPDHEAVFGGMRVGQTAFFYQAEFGGPVSMNHTHLLDLYLGGQPIPELNLEHCHIERELRIVDAELVGLTFKIKKASEAQETEIGTLKARNLTVKGPVLLNTVTISKAADLRYASIQTLEMQEVKWPEEKEHVKLEGLSYQAINTGAESVDPQKLLDWLDGSRFNTQPYYELESYFQRHGNQECADEVFLALKKRQCRENPSNFGLYLWTWFLIGLVGYGRRPLRPLAWVLGLIVLGYFAFSNPNNMIPRHTSIQAAYTNPAITELYSYKDKVFEEKGLEHYNWFWYTIDLMLPIDLDMAKYYEPKLDLARVYFHLLPLAGWVIIAALAASLTGLFELKGHLREH